jgi:hypothetical protein
VRCGSAGVETEEKRQTENDPNFLPYVYTCEIESESEVSEFLKEPWLNFSFKRRTDVEKRLVDCKYSRQRHFLGLEETRFMDNLHVKTQNSE